MLATPTVSDLVRVRAASGPARPVLHFDDDVLTYADLDARADSCAGRLAALGVDVGDAVAVVLDTCADAVVAWVALARLGAVEVPLNPALRGASLAHPLRTTQTRLVLTSGRFLDTVREAVALLDPGVVIALVDDGNDQYAPSAVRIAELTPAVPTARRSVDATDRSVIMFSSGTTGPSKGVVLTHATNQTLAGAVVEAMAYNSSDVLYNVFPLSHVNARFTTVLAAMMADARAVLHRRFSASGFWKGCRMHGVTAFNYMGATTALLLAQPAHPHDRDHGVRRAYGSGTVGRLQRQFEDRFGVAMVETYGSTELGMVTHTARGKAPGGSCGRAVDGYQLAVHDAQGRALAPGEVGEIVVRPSGPGQMFREYAGDPDATVEAWRDLWFHTGDRGRLDAHGWLTFVDRTKDTIRRRGENISAWEVEQAVSSHPAVADACAVGVPSDISGEEVLVAVVVRHRVSPSELLQASAAHLARYAVPRYLRFVDALPKTHSARTEKYKVRAEGITPDTWDREHADGAGRGDAGRR